MTTTRNTTTGTQALTRDEALRILRAHQVELRERFGVTELALFGSTVRNEARPDSDVDLLVNMDIAGDWTRSFQLQFFLEDLLGHSVDLIVNGSVREAFRARVEREAVNAWR